MKPTALITCFLIAILSSMCSQKGSAQDLSNGDFANGMDGWALAFPKEAPAKSEIVADGVDGQHALKIEAAETEIEPWKGKLSHKVDLPAAGGYTITFSAKSEPNENHVELSVWGSQTDKPRLIGERKNFKLGNEWQEFTYFFTADNPDPAANINWINLAKSGMTFYFANVRIVKE